MDLGPELHQHHHAHTGRIWLDTVLAVSAVVISLFTAVLAFHQGGAMERMVKENEHMVQASTWPYIALYSTNVDAAGHDLYIVGAENRGVGPAEIESMYFSYKGRRLRSAGELSRLVAHDAGHDVTPRLLTSDIAGVIPARQSFPVLEATPSISAPWLIEALRKSGSDIDLTVCYCSILGECWIAEKDATSRHPHPVSRCE